MSVINKKDIYLKSYIDRGDHIKYYLQTKLFRIVLNKFLCLSSAFQLERKLIKCSRFPATAAPLSPT